MTQQLTLGDRKSYAFLIESLDSKQRLYIEARSHGSVPVVAARIAGYKSPDDAAMELEADPQIRMTLELAVRLQARQQRITLDDVTGWMLDALRNSATATEQIAAARELAKLHGLYEPTKIDINKTVTLKKEQLAQMDDEALLRIAKGAIDADYKILDFVPEPLDAAPG